MILKSLTVPIGEFERATGWTIKPEGACKGETCVPLSNPPADIVNIEVIANDMNMPLAAEANAGLWALGPESLGGRTLTSAGAPDFELPDVNGKRFQLSSLKGKKIVVYAWAPY